MDTAITALETAFADLRTRQSELPVPHPTLLAEDFLQRLDSVAAELELGAPPESLANEVAEVWDGRVWSHPSRVADLVQQLEALLCEAQQASARVALLRADLEIWDERLTALDALERLLDELNQHTPPPGDSTP